MSVRLAVIGGGSFGTTLAQAAADAGTDVLVWSRRGADARSTDFRVTSEFSVAAQFETLVLAVPSTHAGEVLRGLGQHLDGRHMVAHVSRGLVAGERGRLHPLSWLITSLTPVRRVGVLAGPLVPRELAGGRPSGGVVGTHFPELADALRSALGGPGHRLRLYESRDMMGVELASALIGALLFTLGYARALGSSPSALGMLGTRGLAEITRIGVAMGADERTFSGLAGVGDLLAAVAGARRPEIALGEQAAAGADLAAALGPAGVHAESAGVASLVAAHARRLGIEAPISTAVSAVLAGELSAEQAMERLSGRPVGRE